MRRLRCRLIRRLLRAELRSRVLSLPEYQETYTAMQKSFLLLEDEERLRRRDKILRKDLAN